MTENELISAVRSRCGKVSNTEELSDDDITREGGWILDRICERITDKVLRYFTGTKDQREYSPHENTVRVQKVYPPEVYDSYFASLGTHKETANLSDPVDFYYWPSLNVINRQRLLRSIPAFSWKWNHIRRVIVIDPAPYVDGEYYYYISIEKVNWTIANLPEDLEELLVTGTAWRCLEIVILKRSDLGGIHRAGGMVDYPARSMKGFIDSKRDEFYDMLRIKSMIYSRR